MKAVLVVVYAAIAVCTAHVCLLDPRQRGKMTGLDTIGSTDCGIVVGPCGNTNGGDSVSTYLANSTFSVTFQKNMDHSAPPNLGYFEIRLGNADGPKGQLAHVTDDREPSLFLYSVNVTLDSSIVPGDYYVQVLYHTMNPMAQPVYYQCADITVV